MKKLEKKSSEASKKGFGDEDSNKESNLDNDFEDGHIPRRVGMAMGQAELCPHSYPFSKITPIFIPTPIRH